MIDEDKELLKSLLIAYSGNDVIEAVAEVSADLADEFSDLGINDRAKEFSLLTTRVENLIEGKMILVQS